MAHALAANFGQRDFHTAFFADHAAMLQALVFAAQAFVVFDRPENFRAKQAIAFRFESAVVDGFRLLDFAIRPRANLLRAGKPDLDRIEFFFLRDLLE